MPAQKIMIIRHAERPDPAQNIFGVTAAGNQDEHELSVRGWQRSGALVRFFNPTPPAPITTGLAVPEAVYATNPSDANPSKRPMRTVEALAEDLRKSLDTRFSEGDEAALVAEMNLDTTRNNVLICWHHGHIDNIARKLGVNNTGKWPDDRFDMVWVFDRDGTGWRFHEINQHLLPGDTCRSAAPTP